MSKVYNKENVPSVGLRNRPIVNLDKPQLDLNPKFIIDPSATRKVLVTPHRRNYKKLKRAQSSMSIKENLWQWIIEISFII